MLKKAVQEVQKRNQKKPDVKTADSSVFGNILERFNQKQQKADDPADSVEANAERHPLKRIGRADDIASKSKFLLSEEASWITGQVIHIDGGMSAIR